MSRHIPVGGYGTGDRGERNGSAQISRRFLRADHRFRRTAGVRVARIVHGCLRSTVLAVNRGGCRVGRHIA